MRKQILLLFCLFASLCLHAQVYPVISPSTEYGDAKGDVWYYIQFEDLNDGNGVLYFSRYNSTGTFGGRIRAFAKDDPTGQQQWKFIVDPNNPDNLIIELKEGGQVCYGASPSSDSKYFQAGTANTGQVHPISGKSTLCSFQIQPATGGFYLYDAISKLIMTRGSLSNGTKGFTNATTSGTDASSLVNFIPVNPKTNPDPDPDPDPDPNDLLPVILSPSGNHGDKNGDVWYFVIFDDMKVLAQYVSTTSTLNNRLHAESKLTNPDNQLWKFIKDPTSGSYVMINKGGGDLVYGAITSSTPLYHVSTSLPPEYRALIKFEKFDADYYTLYDKRNDKRINEGSSDAISGNSIGNGVVFSLLENLYPSEKAETPPVVVSSSSSGETWYYIIFKESGLGLTQSAENTLTYNTIVKGNANQLWKVISSGRQNFYILENKNGDQIYFDNGNYYAGKTTTEATFLHFQKTLSTTYPNTYELYRVGSKGLDHLAKPTVSSGGVSIMEHGSGSALCVLDFVSQQDYDVAIKNPEIVSGAKIIQEGNVVKIEGNNIQKVTLFSVTGQKLLEKSADFRFEISQAGCYIAHIFYQNNLSESKKIIIH